MDKNLIKTARWVFGIIALLYLIQYLSYGHL